MNKKEAGEILQAEMHKIKALSYADCRAWVLAKEPRLFQVTGASGTEYQLEIAAFWDNPRMPDAEIRVMGSIDDGGLLSSFKPLCVSFIIAADGSFVDE